MSETTRSANTPTSMETGLFTRKWKAIRFFFEKRTFESKLEGILRAAFGHEGNSLPAGDRSYRLLNAEANSLCTEFAESWDLESERLRTRIPGLSRLERLATPKQLMNCGRFAWLGVLCVPLALFVIGALAGLVSLGFHLVGGR
jgi:hypothetical protein